MAVDSIRLGDTVTVDDHSREVLEVRSWNHTLVVGPRTHPRIVADSEVETA